MTAKAVKALPMAEKIQIMEALWEDLRVRFDQSDLPHRIKDILDQRRARVREGSAKVVDWDAVKTSIGRA